MTRPRLQLHLSTLLIVSLMAAGLVWLNVREVQSENFVHVRSAAPEDRREVLVMRKPLTQGWPFTFETFFEEGKFQLNDWEWKVFSVDAAICLALLAVAAVAIEWLMRRMKRGAP